MSSAPQSQSHNAAAASLLSGDVLAARDFCFAGLTKTPQAAELLHLLGLTFVREGVFQHAVGPLSQALELEPARSSWHTDLGTVFGNLKQSGKAVRSFQRAYELDPRDAENLVGYARALLELRRFEECVGITRILLDVAPNSAAAPRILMGCLRQLAQLDQVLSIAESLATTRSLEYPVLELLFHAQWEMGDVQGCIQTLDRVRSLGLDTAGTESFRLNALLHEQSHTPESIVHSHRAWAERFCPLSHRPDRSPFTNLLTGNTRLRIGYVTEEFRCCPGYHFLLPLLKAHDRENFEVFCFSGCAQVDTCGQAIQKLGHPWHSIHGLDDEAISELFRKLEIDIAVDLSGHFSAERLPALANRLAPVQVFYPNYPATSGIAAFDYVVTDRWLCPAGLESNYSETVLRLPSGFIVHQPPGHLEITPLPARSNGFVTFGLFQRAAKLNSACWDAIAGVLRAVPASRLLIQYASALRAPFTAEMETRGISGNRLDFRDWLPIRERVRLLGDVDISLDTFPYNGQTTTCECLWMGVPVVTRSGRSHVSRVAKSILHQVGLANWVAESYQEYINIAASAARDLDSLEALRANMRDRLTKSPLLDAALKTRELELAYRQMWNTHVIRTAAAHSAAPTLNPA